MAAQPKVFQFKLVLLGDSAVGKSSLVLRFVRGQFFEYQESTIGGEHTRMTVGLLVFQCNLCLPSSDLFLASLRSFV